MIVLNLTGNDDHDMWLKLHGEPLGDDRVMCSTQCRELLSGLCRHYEKRPQLCKDWEVGCPGCIEVVKMRRGKKADRIISLIDMFAREEKNRGPTTQS